MNDAFHHIPNQRDVLRELHRVLRPDGIVFMSEPGRGHASSEHSTAESATGVLENELVLEDVAALARACGFAAVNVVVASPSVRHEVSAEQLGAFMGGRRFAAYWKALCHALEQHHYVVLHKSASVPTTRRPGRLSAGITVAAPGSGIRVSSGEAVPFTLRIRNAGDTQWLNHEEHGRGWTRVGVHLYRESDTREPVAFDWCRFDLNADVGPGAETEVAGELPPLPEQGQYLVVFDLVVEGLTWFAERGSPTAALELAVQPRGSGVNGGARRGSESL
jgi:hypothetical protein